MMKKIFKKIIQLNVYYFIAVMLLLNVINILNMDTKYGLIIEIITLILNGVFLIRFDIINFTHFRWFVSVVIVFMVAILAIFVAPLFFNKNNIHINWIKMIMCVNQTFSWLSTGIVLLNRVDKIKECNSKKTEKELDDIIEELNKAEALIKRTKKYINDENKDEALEIIKITVLNVNDVINQYSNLKIQKFKNVCECLYSDKINIKNTEIIENNALKVTYVLAQKYKLECVLNINQSLEELIYQFLNEINFEIGKIQQDLTYLNKKLNCISDNFIESID